jgi:hypothetical protein
MALAALACIAGGMGACSKGSDSAEVTGVSNTLLVVNVLPFRFGEIGTCNEFQLSVSATDASGAVVAVDSAVWTSGDSTSISVTRTGGLITSHQASSAVTINVTAWAGKKFGGATALWDASIDAVQILDAHGNPYPEPPCPGGTAPNP